MDWALPYTPEQEEFRKEVRAWLDANMPEEMKDPGVRNGGAQEVNQRTRAGQNHAGGSTNIAKVILSRRIGISRTQ